MENSAPAITRLLHSWRLGNANAVNELVPLVYDQLHRLAASHLKHERPGHTLAATALVNEAYLKIVGAEVNYNDRSHFFAIASTAMRRILVDHAKHNKRQRRGGEAVRGDFEEALMVAGEADPFILHIDEALNRLGLMDPRKVSIFEMTYFGGMSYAEVGQALGISDATVKRDLRVARAWMKHELQPGGDAISESAASGSQ